MPKPTNKKELLEQSQESYDKLISLIKSYPKDKLDDNFSGATLNRNVRDVVVHLHTWHGFLLSWHKAGSNGKEVVMPAAGYTWQTLPALNKKIWEETQNVDTKTALKQLASSFNKVTKVMMQHSDEELFTKKYYDWTGSTSLGAYLIMNTCSHYRWGYKVIKKGMK